MDASAGAQAGSGIPPARFLSGQAVGLPRRQDFTGSGRRDVGGHTEVPQLNDRPDLRIRGGRRREKAITQRRASQLLSAAGFTSIAWHDLHAIIIKAVTATT